MLPLAKLLMDAMYEPAFVPNVACGVDKSFPLWLYVAVLVGILVLYFIIDHLLIYRIRQMVPAESVNLNENVNSSYGLS